MSSYPPLADLIPHSGKMIFLDKIVGHSRRSLSATCQPFETHSCFAKKGMVSICSSVEYMAQATAAFLALRSKDHACQPTIHSQPRAGLLVSIRNVKFSRMWLVAGEKLVVEVTLDEQCGDFATFAGVIETADGEKVVKGSFGVYTPTQI